MFTFSILILSITFKVLAQEMLSAKELNPQGVFGINLKGTTIHGNTVPVTNIRGGWVIMQDWAMGIDFNFVAPTSRIDNIYEDIDVIPIGAYAGLYLEKSFWSHRLIHFSIPVAFGWGSIFYLKDWSQDKSGTDDLKDGDYFNYIEPGLIGELNVMKNLRLNFGFTGRITSKLDLAGTDSDTFRGLNYGIGVKIGNY